MSQDMMLFLVRILGYVLVVALLLLAFRLLRWLFADLKNHQDTLRKKRAGRQRLDAQIFWQEDSYDEQILGESRQKTLRLNPSFFSAMVSKEGKALPEFSQMPTMTLALTIMARYGQTFNGEQLQQLFKTFGLKRSPHDVYELIAGNNQDVFFSVLRVRKPITFPEDLTTLAHCEGILCVLQLPLAEPAQKSFETFLAVVMEMAESVDGRLCDEGRRPLAERDMLRYKEQVARFELEYNAWLAQVNFS